MHFRGLTTSSVMFLKGKCYRWRRQKIQGGLNWENGTKHWTGYTCCFPVFNFHDLNGTHSFVLQQERDIMEMSFLTALLIFTKDEKLTTKACSYISWLYNLSEEAKPHKKKV